MSVSSNQRTFELTKLYSALLHGGLEDSGEEYRVPQEDLTAPDTHIGSNGSLDKKEEVRVKAYTPKGRDMDEIPSIILEGYQRSGKIQATSSFDDFDELYRLRDIRLDPFGNDFSQVQKVGELWGSVRKGDFTPIEIYNEELGPMIDSCSSTILKEPILLGYPVTETYDFDHLLFGMDDQGQTLQVYSDSENEGHYRHVEVEGDWLENMKPSMERRIFPEFTPSRAYKWLSKIR